MSIRDKWAQAIYNIATGNKKRRAILTPIAAIIFFGIITFFVFCSFWVDRWLNLPHLPDSWWRYAVAGVFFITGLFLAVATVTKFFSTKGTPVPTLPPPKLITTGLYSWVRNPMALGMLLILESLGFYFGSLSLIIFFAPLPVVLYALEIKAVEEPELEMRFGKDYREYKKRVPMFIPGLRRKINARVNH